MQRLLFEYSPAFILACLALAVGYAWLLYRAKATWGPRANQFLFALRALLVFLLAFLLIGPVLKLTHNFTEKPALVFLVDNSLSVKETTDSSRRQKMEREISRIKKSLEGEGYAVALSDLSGKEGNISNFSFLTSDLAGALRTITGNYEGKNLSGIVLFSDGIYNSGASPLYSPLRIPVYTVGLGDTAQRVDLVLKNLAFNKIAYQGNKFPLRAEVLVQGLSHQDVMVSVSQGGKRLTQQMKNTGTKLLLDFDFQLDAKEKGLQRIDVIVEPLPQESNKKNNRASAFVEVVEGKKRILLIAPAPHPDIKAFRSVVEKNSNYEFVLHIPGVKEGDPSLLQPGKTDLIIFHQAGDALGKTTALFSKLAKGQTSVLVVIGAGSNLRQLSANGIPLTFENIGQWDEVTPVINPSYRDFGFSDNINSAFSKYPPVTTPFGKFSYPAHASVLLYQRIGSVNTDRPLVFTYDEGNHKTGVVVGEGIWRWRLNEFSESEKTESFDEVFSKLIQYLSTQEDKRKFRSFPIQNEFTDAEPVVFESQVYNDLFEQVYGNKIELELRDESGKSVLYNYVSSPGSTRYRIGGLKEGVYRYKASTDRNGNREEVRGEFLVTAQNIESQNLTADFGLLRQLAYSTGGKFYTANDVTRLENDLKNREARGLIHSEENFDPLINLKWVFALLLLLISTEWFLRKYWGAY
jgi:hypothetical protein